MMLALETPYISATKRTVSPGCTRYALNGPVAIVLSAAGVVVAAVAGATFDWIAVLTTAVWVGCAAAVEALLDVTVGAADCVGAGVAPIGATAIACVALATVAATGWRGGALKTPSLASTAATTTGTSPRSGTSHHPRNCCRKRPLAE